MKMFSTLKFVILQFCFAYTFPNLASASGVDDDRMTEGKISRVIMDFEAKQAECRVSHGWDWYYGYSATCEPCGEGCVNPADNMKKTCYMFCYEFMVQQMKDKEIQLKLKIANDYDLAREEEQTRINKSYETWLTILSVGLGVVIAVLLIVAVVGYHRYRNAFNRDHPVQQNSDDKYEEGLITESASSLESQQSAV
ncbi:uncharacterized protein LOC104266312 [Ciona intestinalis]